MNLVLIQFKTKKWALLWSSGPWRRHELPGGDLQTRGGEGEDGSQQKGPSTVTVRRQDAANPLTLSCLCIISHLCLLSHTHKQWMQIRRRYQRREVFSVSRHKEGAGCAIHPLVAALTHCSFRTPRVECSEEQTCQSTDVSTQLNQRLSWFTAGLFVFEPVLAEFVFMLLLREQKYLNNLMFLCSRMQYSSSCTVIAYCQCPRHVAAYTVYIP